MDVAQGESPHPEAIYINSEKMAEAQPVSPTARVRAAFGHPHDGVRTLHDGDGDREDDGNRAGSGSSGVREARGEV